MWELVRAMMNAVTFHSALCIPYLARFTKKTIVSGEKELQNMLSLEVFGF